MEIPVSFKIGKHEHNVLTVGSVTRIKGHFYPSSRALVVAVASNKKRRPAKEVSETFWHEVTHAILHDMDHPLWRDEKFVTAFSNRLNQVIHTARLP